MALNDIVGPVENPGLLNETRGNIGVITDINVQAMSDIELILITSSISDGDFVYIA